MAALCLVLLGAAVDDPVLAERGDDHITVSQARALIAAADPATRQKLTTDPASLKTFLQTLLLQRAILQAAAAAKWDQRADVAALVQRAHDQVVAQSFLAAQAPVPAGYPSEADVQAAYDQNKARLMQPRTYHLAQVFLPRANYGTPDEGRRKLLPVRTQIQRGRLSLEAAGRQGGLQYLDSGWVSEAQLAPPVKSAVAGLPEGTLSDPVCMENGCHLIRLLATRPAGPAPLASVHDDLVRALKQQKQQAGESAYANGLLAKQPVAINEIQLSRIEK